MRISPTARSLAHLRKHGWTCCVVEQHIRPPQKKPGIPDFGFKRDAFNFGDILACQEVDFPMTTDLDVTGGIALIQTTSGAHVAHRRAKILGEPKARTWLMAGGRIVIHGWAKRGSRGKRKLWTLHEEEVTLSAFALEPQETPAPLATARRPAP